MKKVLLLILIILLLVLGFGWKYLIDRAPIFTGYAAKEVASCLFVNGRDYRSVKENDINFSLIPLSTVIIDSAGKSVTANFLGFAEQKAVYRPGLGCALIADGDEAYARSMKATEAVLPQDAQNIFWPMGDKQRDTALSRVNYQKLQAAIDSAFKPGNKTRAVVVAIDTLVFKEKYAPGFNKNMRILGWSMSKSITNALIGTLVKQGKLQLDAPAPIDEWKNDKRKNISLNSLMHMTSGLQWVEDYGDISEATIMLYEKGDVGRYALSVPAHYPPDSVWYYSSGTSNILSYIIRRTIGNDQEYWNYPRKALFNKIGMRSAIMETDASGTFVGSSYTQAVPRDWARFGLLYLNKGIWGKDTILPTGWVDYTTEVAPNSKGEYGAQFWLNHSQKELPDAPKDIFYCDGFNGQRVYIVPSKRLVIVRMGLSKSGEFDYNRFVSDILNAVDNP